MGDCQRPSGGDGHADNRIGAESGFVVCAVKRDQGTIELREVVEGPSLHGTGDLSVDAGNSPQHSIPIESSFVAVSQLDRLARTG